MSIFCCGRPQSHKSISLGATNTQMGWLLGAAGLSPLLDPERPHPVQHRGNLKPARTGEIAGVPFACPDEAGLTRGKPAATAVHPLHIRRSGLVAPAACRYYSQAKTIDIGLGQKPAQNPGQR